MKRLVGWHVTAGTYGLRFLLLHLLWIAHTLLGGVVLGAAPATVAVYRVLRRDRLTAEVDRPGLAGEFHRLWREEFGSANLTLLPGMAVLAFMIWDRQQLGLVDHPAIAGLLGFWLPVLAVTTAVCLITVLPVIAQFSDSPFGHWSRTLRMVFQHPMSVLLHAFVLLVLASIEYALPGLLMAFGIVPVGWASLAICQRMGWLPTTDLLSTSTPAQVGT